MDFLTPEVIAQIARDVPAFGAVIGFWFLLVKPVMERIENTMRWGFWELSRRLPPPADDHGAPPPSMGPPPAPGPAPAPAPPPSPPVGWMDPRPGFPPPSTARVQG